MKKNKRKSQAALPNRQQHQTLTITAFLFIAAFLLFSPYAQGLFISTAINFEENFNVFLLFGSLLVIVAAVFMYRFHKDDQSHWIYYAVWLLPITYLLSYFTAINAHSALNAVFLHLILAAFFVIGAYLISRFGNLLMWAILIPGYTIVMFGLAHWFGWHYYREAVLQGRLASVFQYANTNAIYDIGLALCSLYLLIAYSRKWSVSLPVSFMIVPTLISFLLTSSRGALIVFPLLVLIVSLFLPLVKQVTYLAYLIFGLGITFAIYRYVHAPGVELEHSFDLSKSLSGWGALMLGAVIMVGVTYLYQRYCEAFLTRKLQLKLSRLYLPAVALILFVIGIIFVFLLPDRLSWLPDTVRNRLANISLEQTSVVERFAFYTDSYALFADHPITGAGGGAWSAAFETYKTSLYTSRESHNFYVQYLLETGAFGFMILIAFISYIIYRYIRQSMSTGITKEGLVLFIFAIAILVHSFLDFNMSFAYIRSLVFLSLGGIFALSKPVRASLPSAHKPWLPTSAVVIISIAALVTCFMSIRFIQGNNAFQAANHEMTGSARYDVISHNIDQALDLQPNFGLYHLFKANLLTQVYSQTSESTFYDQAFAVYSNLLAMEPYNNQAYLSMINLLLMKNDHANVLKYADKGITLFPLEIHYYSQAIISAYQLYSNSTDEQGKKRYSDQIRSYYRLVETKQAELKKENGDDVDLTSFTLAEDIVHIVQSLQV